MNYVLIIHDVKDYRSWKKIFDDAAAIRKAAGELNYFVLRDERDENRIVHFSQWASLDNARDFFESPKLAEIRHRAGVDAPQFNYLKCLEIGTL